MKNKSMLLLGILVLSFLVFYMVTYSVGFNEMAVLTTFEKAGEGAVKNVDGESAGLYWKWPAPIQTVRKYDTRIRMLEDRIEEQQTLDKQDIIIQTYVAWKVTDALQFYTSMGTIESAERKIRSTLRDARSVFGNYTFNQMTNIDSNKQKLSEIEALIRKQIQQVATNPSKPWGVEISEVGIKRIILPEKVSETVFATMRKTRERLAQSARSEGDAKASDITAKASRDADTIMAFALLRAQQIRAEGDAAASDYFAIFKQDEEFAIFLRKIEALKLTLKNNTTFLMDPSFAPMDLFLKRPGKQSDKTK